MHTIIIIHYVEHLTVLLVSVRYGYWMQLQYCNNNNNNNNSNNNNIIQTMEIRLLATTFYLSWNDTPLVKDRSVWLDAQDSSLGHSKLILFDLVVDVRLLLAVCDDDVNKTLLGQVVAQLVRNVGETL